MIYTVQIQARPRIFKSAIFTAKCDSHYSGPTLGISGRQPHRLETTTNWCVHGHRINHPVLRYTYGPHDAGTIVRRPGRLRGSTGPTIHNVIGPITDPDFVSPIWAYFLHPIDDHLFGHFFHLPLFEGAETPLDSIRNPGKPAYLRHGC